MNQAPLLRLTQRTARLRAPIDAPVIAAQLGILPDLRYLVEGLRRSRTCICNFHDELTECLRAVPGSRLEPLELLDGIDRLLVWCQSQAWGGDDPKTLPMGRPATRAEHPLKGYCLSVSFHWPNLFYTLEPNPDTSGTDAATHPFESLMAEFSVYVIAAQSTIDPTDHLNYCNDWWTSKQLPSRSAFPDRRLASRVAAASRGVRRLGLQEHRKLFDHLVDQARGDRLHERITSAIRRKWNVGDDQLLNAIALLLEEVRPGWFRLSHSRKRGKTRKRSGVRIVRRQRYRDGYVRVLGEAIRIGTTTDAGLEIEHTRSLPASVESLTQELTSTWQTEIESDPDSPAARQHFVAGKRPSRKDLRAAAEREAKIILEGTEWLPADEAGEGPELESIVVGQETEGGQGVELERVTSKWVAQHLRRSQFAHALGPNRLTPGDAKRLLDCIRAAPSDTPDRLALVAVHACLALGRPFREVVRLRIHDGTEHPATGVDDIHYSIAARKWIVPCPAPAWIERETDPDERPQWPLMWLWDQTAFANLLKRFRLANGGQPFTKSLDVCERAASAFIRSSLPHANATLSQCSDFLFYQLLACTQGDVGIASLITGHQHSHSRSVRHYAHYPASQVWAAYRTAWDAVRSDSVALSASGLAGSSPRDHGGFGAKRVPTAVSVARVFAHLASATRSGKTSMERHNAYTAYTLAALVLALGVRPLVDVRIMDVGEWVGGGLLPTYVDKARSDYDRRVNAMPEQVVAHLYRYVAYRERLHVTGPQRIVRATWIYVDADGRQERFRPSDFQRTTGKAFTLEPYAFRRYLRTELRCTHAVPAEDVDAWLGHWHHGVSPYDRFSTYPLRRLQALAGGAVAEMLKRIGFRPLAPPR